MKKLMRMAILATVVLGLLAGSVLAGPSGPQADEPDQLREWTRTQTCDPAQDCDGDQLRYRSRTQQNWPDDPLEILLWLFGIE